MKNLKKDGKKGCLKNVKKYQINFKKKQEYIFMIKKVNM